MKKITRLLATAALLFGVVGGASSAKVYEIDYSTKTGFPFYVMGYVPEWVEGVMTDYGSMYKYESTSYEPADGETLVGTVSTQGGTEYKKIQLASSGWHQYIISESFPTEVGGIYTVKALVKASATCTFNVDMRWAWSGQSPLQVGTNVTIPQSDEFVEVEWTYSGIGGTSCQLVAQPGGTTATIEWKSLAVYSYDGSKNHVLRVTNSSAKENIYDNQLTYTFAKPLTAGTKYTVNAKICAADVTRGAVMRFVLSGGDPKYGGDKAILANTFTQVTQEFTAASNTGLELDLGFINGRVYIDDVSVVAEGSSTNLVSNDDFEEPCVTTGWSVPSWTNQSMGHSEKEQGDVALVAHKVTIGTTGWATMIAPDFPVSVPAGVDAYYAKYDSEKKYVKLTPVESMPLYGRAVINGEPGDYYFPQIAASATSWDYNGMEISWGSVVSDGTHYALGAIGGKVGFVKVKKDVTIPSGKPYLVIPANNAREFIGFGEDETTAIRGMENEELIMENSYFDLQGRRVAQPAKGLYIVNGKKVVVK